MDEKDKVYEKLNIKLPNLDEVLVSRKTESSLLRGAVRENIF